MGKRYGQHFTRDPRLLAEIVGAAAPAGEEVLEIGAGRGALTRALSAAGAARIVAVEIDERLRVSLEAAVAALPGVEVVWADILDVAAETLRPPPGGFVVAANLPFQISTPVLFRLLDGEIPWRRAALTLQSEVADRMAAAPGSKIYGALSVAAQAAASVEITARFASGSFRPRPRVESAVVRLTPSGRAYDHAALRDILRAAFSRRRKVLSNALPGYDLAAAGLDPRVRPEEVPVEGYLRLAG